jgi:hypothetical protein
MNVYAVVEGRIVEKAIYKAWIPLVNGTKTFATYIEDVVASNF